jgi:hypothetical protein
MRALFLDSIRHTSPALLHYRGTAQSQSTPPVEFIVPELTFRRTMYAQSWYRYIVLRDWEGHSEHPVTLVT